MSERLRRERIEEMATTAWDIERQLKRLEQRVQEQRERVGWSERQVKGPMKLLEILRMNASVLAAWLTTEAAKDPSVPTEDL